MPSGGITSSNDAVGIAVVNYKAPILETKEDVLANCQKIARKVSAAKNGYPGLDLLIFPEYSTQGFHPDKWRDLTTRLDGPEVAIFREACRKSKVWGIFSLTGEEHPEGKNPYNTMVLIDDAGEVAYTTRKLFPWDPQEPWTAGSATAVCEGPKGIVLGGLICYDVAFPEIARDIAMKGGELLVIIQGAMYPGAEQYQLLTRARAIENNMCVAMANMAGSDLTYTYWGSSMLCDFDGTVITRTTSEEDGISFGTISLTALRDARRNWTGENHLYNIMHRGYTSEPGGNAACPFDFYKTWVNAPAEAKRNSELLTRDADDPAAASGKDPVAAPPQSALWAATANGAAKKRKLENGV